MKHPRVFVAPLLFSSGFCALIYQVVWLRELRLVFGASTPASAAVLAVFMAGLGWGSLVLSKRADQSKRPLRTYAHLELGIALTALITPFLLDLVRLVYVWMGGTTSMGLGLGTGVRLLLAGLVLLPPTFLMGGTLPAAARAAESTADVGRCSTALLYGFNTMGAVTGAALSTFVLLEVLGIRVTLWSGALFNLIVGLAARGLDRRLDYTEIQAESSASAEEAPAPLIAKGTGWFVLVAAGVVGFVFLLMELVWYRMLAPLLGGTSYTFGLILAVALLGTAMNTASNPQVYAKSRSRG